MVNVLDSRPVVEGLTINAVFAEILLSDLAFVSHEEEVSACILLVGNNFECIASNLAADMDFFSRGLRVAASSRRSFLRRHSVGQNVAKIKTSLIFMSQVET